MIPFRNLQRFTAKAIKEPAYAFRVFKKRLNAYLHYLFANGRSSYPEAITLFLTYRCNLQCRMCGQWRIKELNKGGEQNSDLELLVSELKILIDDISRFRPNITLFGGEPLLYSGCMELVKYIKLKGMHCLMITNGFLLEEMAKDIVASGLDELNVSLDGDREIHDQIRGMEGLFDKIIRGFEKINYLKNDMRQRKPRINLQCTITRYNYKSLEKLLDVAKNIKADSVTFHNLIFLSKEVLEKQESFNAILGCNSQNWEGFVFDPEIDLPLLHMKIKEILSGRHPFNVNFYPNFSFKGLEEYYNDPLSLPSGYPARCLSPWVVAYIFPDGQVRPCLNLDYAFGNIKNNKFTKIWNNRQAVEFRQMLSKNKLFPVCPRCTELYRY